MKPEDLQPDDSLESALLDARMWLVKAETENQIAALETSKDGWLCDHAGIVDDCIREYEKAISRVRAFNKIKTRPMTLHKNILKCHAIQREEK